MSDREQVLGAVRAALGREGPLDEADRAALDARDGERRRHTQPALDADPVAQMRAMMAKVEMGLSELPDEAALGEAVLDFLRRHQLPPALVVDPALAARDWPAELQVRAGGAGADDLSSLTGCLAAVAETGSILMRTDAQASATARFLPDNHLVVLRREQIVERLEDALALARAENGQRSRALHLNTGPSRTGDVEQVIEIGAHGPRRMHVFLIG